MKVLHVCEVTHGGVTTLINTLADHQAARGDDVHLLVPGEAASPPGDGLRRPTTHRWAPERRRPYRWPAAVSTLRETVGEVAPDVVHLHSFFPGLFGRVTRLPVSVRVVYQPHSWAFAAGAAVGPVGEWAVAAWERRAWPRTHAVVVNCRDELAEGRAHGLAVDDGRGHVVGLPVDTARFAPRTCPRMANRRILVCVGRLGRQKGQEALAAAWRAAPVEDAILVLVGPGDPGAVRAAAGRTWGGSLRWVGAADDVRPWLHAADLLVMPSLYEGQSVAMAEALACGLPVVATDVNGAREAVTPDGRPPAGAVVGDLPALLDACRELLADPGLLAEEREAARSHAVELFDPPRVLKRLDRAYGRPRPVVAAQTRSREVTPA